MNINLMSKTLTQKLYEWGIYEAVNEAQTEFFRLSKMNSWGINEAIWAIDSLGLDKQLALHALIKVNYNKLVNITVSEEEKSSFDRIMEAARSLEIRQMVEKRESQLVTIEKRKLKQLVKQFWVEQFGTKIASDLYFETKINDLFLVATYLDCGKDFCYYFHHFFLISNTNNQKIKINLFPVNLPRCLGMYADGWCFLSEENAVESIQDIVSYCKYFLNYAPHLLSGLEEFA